MAYKLTAVVGARPNYMKVAPIWRAMDERAHVERRLIHTGQHYDQNMSRVFFEDLRLPKPDVYLGVGSGSHGEQTAKVMVALEEELQRHPCDVLVVVGDVNSTMAGALVAVKLGIPVAHVEAGLRSFDRTMPEEINRMVTDIISELLFTTTKSAETNLRREGVDPSKIHFVGNVMIDSLHFYRPLAEKSAILAELGVTEGGYGLVTLHRPSNVDDPAILGGILRALSTLAAEVPLVFPVHPRTRKVMQNSKLHVPSDNIKLIDPVGYLDFAKLMMYTKIVLTDSGGIQEETTVLGIPCLTIRENTERPITIEVGTNRLVGTDPKRISDEGLKVLRGDRAPTQVPEFWDGQAAPRIAGVLDEYFR